MADLVPVTIVNHVAVDIGVSPDTLWREILDAYVEVRKFREIARIESIDHPSAVLGGYHMRIEHEGVVDERDIHFTERDDSARRLSIFADYLTVPAGGMKVWATYQAQEIPTGARYAIDCHARLNVEAPAGGGKAEMAAAVAELKIQFDTSLIAYLEGVRAELDAAA